LYYYYILKPFVFVVLTKRLMKCVYEGKKYHGNNREKCVLTSLLFEEWVKLLAQLFFNSHLKKAHREGLNIKHEKRHKKKAIL
jgi:hypothetical protein